MRTAHIIVNGRVQGVFYRTNTEKKAAELGIFGTVQNLPNGDVEIYAQGRFLQEFVAWCGQGPRFARVDSVTVEELEHEPYHNFGALP